MRTRGRRLRSRRERGSALLIAVIMIFVIVAMMELMLAAPKSELVKVRSTVGKEVSLAAADAGIHDAGAWLSGNWGNLGSYLSDPSSGQLGSTSKIVLTYQQYPTGTASPPPGTSVNNGAGGPISTTLAIAAASTAYTYTDPSTLQNVTVSSNFSVPLQVNSTTGMYPFPQNLFDDHTPVPNSTNNYVRFGDPLISRGEYAYRILSMGNGYFQVDCEGRAQSGTYSRSVTGAAPKTVSRITAVFYIQPPPYSPLPGAFCWCGPGSLAGNFGTPSPAPAMSTNNNQSWSPVTIPSPVPSPLPSPVAYLNCNPPSGNGVNFSGADQNNTGTQYAGNTTAFAVQGWALGLEPIGSPGATNSSQNNGGYQSASTSPSIASDSSKWTSVAGLVTYSQQTSGWVPGSDWVSGPTGGGSMTWGDPNTSGTYTGGNGNTNVSVSTACIQHFTYGTGVDPANGPFCNYTKQINVSTADGLIYIRFPKTCVIDCATPLIATSGTSTNPAGILILDFEDGVSFVNDTTSNGSSNYWFMDDGNPSAWQGGVIAYQRGRINLAHVGSNATDNGTTVLNWIYSNGSQAHGILYNSQAVSKAITAIHPPTKLVSYTVTQ